MSTQGFTASGLQSLHDAMQAIVTSNHVAGMVTLVSRHGQIDIDGVGVQDIASGTPMAPDTIFRIASMTKAVLATATLQLVEDGTLDLDAPVDPWLPELANRRVVQSITGPLDDTVTANRPITVRHLLTLQFGLGALMFNEGESPLQDAMTAAGVAPGPFQPELTPDAWMQALGELPLAHHPGEGWVYHTGFDVLSVLLARVADLPLGDLLQQRIFNPLGMTNTGFFVPEQHLDRLATAYTWENDTLAVADPARGGAWSREPQFPCELVSTASDYLAFARMLMAHGTGPTGQLLSPQSVQQMTTDHISPAIKTAYPFFPGFWNNTGWGFGASVVTETDGSPTSARPGAYGWSGGFHTHWRNDPEHHLVGLLLVQQFMGGPADASLVDTFWQHTYNALTD